MNRSDCLASGDLDRATGPLVTAVIVNFNSWPDVTELVRALAASTEVESGLCEVVVVDNASDGPIPADFPRSGPAVRLIAREVNGGFAVGVNAGWRAARSPWLLLLNPDVVAGDGLLAQVVARIRGFEDGHAGVPGVVGFGLRNPDGSRQPSVGTFPDLARAVWEQLIPRSRRKYQAVWRTKPGPVAWVTGACMLVNSAMLDALGGLDEDFFLYYEEVALCRAAHRLGWRVEYDPSVEVVHLRPLQNRPVTPKMRVRGSHGHSKPSALFSETLTALAVSWALGDRRGRGARLRRVGPGSGAAPRKRGLLADDRRESSGSLAPREPVFWRKGRRGSRPWPRPWLGRLASNPRRPWLLASSRPRPLGRSQRPTVGIASTGSSRDLD